MLNNQSVGEHSWQTMRILLAIWPQAPRNMLVYGIVHDMGEILTGDLPYPTKSLDPHLKKIMDDAEETCVLGMALEWSVPPLRKLNDAENSVWKLAEMIEMWECGLQELMMGNCLANEIVEKVWKEIETRLQNPIIENDIAHAAIYYITKRRSVWTP
jgi:5'-deoxynucleotidase YfbR-like HD superfamily hydrolase